ncbi:hypothetical protein E2C01_071289 [Portunus trituberculatus]|uniref:Uncharacterized protein n=1 Tax=Portunus trituberculatus TaxID=210409 RepID=A0A5B7I403_PORTR|nr:hypothetical protein [Portunus trituberculatus]
MKLGKIPVKPDLVSKLDAPINKVNLDVMGMARVELVYSGPSWQWTELVVTMGRLGIGTTWTTTKVGGERGNKGPVFSRSSQGR